MAGIKRRATRGPLHPTHQNKEHKSRSDRAPRRRPVRQDTSLYSHSIVPGGLLVMSYTTRLIPRTSLTILLEIVRNTS